MTLSKEDKAEIAEMIAEALGKEAEPAECKSWRPEKEEPYFEIDPTENNSIYRCINVVQNVTDRTFELGLGFKTKEEAIKKAEWLKALTTLQEDTKGFKPDWENGWQEKWYVAYDFEDEVLYTAFTEYLKDGPIHFATEKDAQVSINKHEKEWRIFLGVEDEQR